MHEKAKCVCFIYMLPQKVKFKFVQINMKQVSYIYLIAHKNPTLAHLQIIHTMPIHFIGKSDPITKHRQARFDPGKHYVIGHTLHIPDTKSTGECIGSVVECLTRHRGAAGSSLIGITMLCP